MAGQSLRCRCCCLVRPWLPRLRWRVGPVMDQGDSAEFGEGRSKSREPCFRGASRLDGNLRCGCRQRVDQELPHGRSDPSRSRSKFPYRSGT